ncbi:probable ascorbate-specific transmembrane electron transporter 2 [Cryptomeria japonica]|uniref:probable ascorbate-specific transmembrane electron transporter 2 n=1 Tax=Cryptomeria japonica TaxID=3369 RepID=UPI0027D9E8EB|nr:probable ascorbate-specific transmembrane electron transporter 2 [Cryptomeria japonica]
MDSRRFGITAGPVILLVQVFGVTACMLVLYWVLHYGGGLAFHSEKKQRIFNLHPVFMFVGFIFLASQGILSYKIVPVKKDRQKLVHLTLLGLAIILGAIGIYAVFKFHNESHFKDMYSLHSWLGISVISLFGLQWVVGFISFLYPGASKNRRARIVPWHLFFGLFLYVMAIVTVETGILEKLTFEEFKGLNRFSSEAMLVNSTAIVILIFAMLVVLSTILPRE